MARRYYSSTAVETTLSGSISNSATSITVTALSGFPNTTPWTAILDADTASEELVEVTNVAGTTLTVTRGVDGTAAVSHNAGASFRHGVSARDFDEANDHVNDSTGVHGLGASSSVVGTTDTQTLTNKTIDIASNTLTGVAPVANPTFTGVASFPDGSASAPSITNTGDTNTGLAFPDADVVAITTGGTERLRVDASGRTIIGHTTSIAAAVSVNSGLQTLGTANSAASTTVGRWQNNTSAPTSYFLKSRGATIGTHGAVVSGDTVALMRFSASNGSAFARTSEIAALSDGTPSGSEMPGALSFRTTPTGSNTPSERLRIDSNGLITGTGTSLGAWTAYTPSLTNFTLGNGTMAAVYAQIGKMVLVRLRFTAGSTSTFSGRMDISLPGTANTSNIPMGSIIATDASTATNYVGHPRSISTTVVSAWFSGATASAMNNGSPFAWTDSDTFFMTFAYEAA